MLDFMKVMEDELKSGKYYDVKRRSDDFEYKHLKLVEFCNKEINSVLYFLNDEGHKVVLHSYEILDITESKPKVKELELKKGRYYDVITSSNDYKHLNLIEFNYTGIDSFLHFINDEGNNILLDYCEILDICESKEKESKPYKFEIYFNGKQLYPDFKYDIYEELDGGISIIHRNTIIDGITYKEEGEYLRVFTYTDEYFYIRIKNIKKIEYVK